MNNSLDVYHIYFICAGSLFMLLGIWVLYERNRIREKTKVRTGKTTILLNEMPVFQDKYKYLPLYSMVVVGIFLLMLGIGLMYISF